METIRFGEYGGADVLRVEDAPVPAPGAGEALVRHEAIGVNYIDIYQRSGVYKVPLPSGLGGEGAGVVEAVGPGVDGVRVGDRVAYVGGPLGAYAAARVYAADRLVPLPGGVGAEDAAAVIFKGMTAQYLIKDTYPVGPGTIALLPAAAGGVGLILAQWATALGATVIGTVSRPEKVAAAKAAGCAHVLLSSDDIPARVREITGGARAHVAFDSVGKDSWAGSLASLRPRGMMVSFGNASGVVPPIEVGSLATAGSLYVTRPTLGNYVATDADYQARAADVLAALQSGLIRATVAARFKLADAAAAHRALEGRGTIGAVLLLP